MYSFLFITTMATPLFAVNTILSLSSLSSLSALLSSFVILDLGGLAFLSKQLVSALSSCASQSESLWHTNSIAEINSTFGGLEGARAKFSPLDRRDSCAGVRGTLDKIITHLLTWLVTWLLLLEPCDWLLFVRTCTWLLLLSIDCAIDYRLYKSQHLGLSSDLMKSTVVDESLSVSIQSSVWRKFKYIMLNQQNEKSSQVVAFVFFPLWQV